MNDMVENLKYLSFKLCGKGELEDNASDVMGDAAIEIERLRREVKRLSQEPELLRAELITIHNASQKALAGAYNRARETRDAFIEWRDVR
jgi:archaellum component FlaC